MISSLQLLAARTCLRQRSEVRKRSCSSAITSHPLAAGSGQPVCARHQKRLPRNPKRQTPSLRCQKSKQIAWPCSIRLSSTRMISHVSLARHADPDNLVDCAVAKFGFGAVPCAMLAPFKRHSFSADGVACVTDESSKSLKCDPLWLQRRIPSAAHF